MTDEDQPADGETDKIPQWVPDDKDPGREIRDISPKPRSGTGKPKPKC